MSDQRPRTDDVELTLLMPCYNEAATLETCIRKAQGALERLGIAGEVLIADNGSDDGSPAIARRLGARVAPVERRGYGSALLGGIEAARGRYIVMADSDASYDWSRIDPFVERLRQGYDLVMGCRLPKGQGRIVPGAMPWSHRWIGNPALSALGRLFFHCPVTDFHCGMRGFRKDSIERLRLQTTGMEFASEMVIKATLLGLKITEAPITLYPDGRGRPPHLRTWRDGWRHLRFMLLFSPRWLFLVPGLALMALSALGFALILPRPMSVGEVTLDVNTLVVCSLLFLIGFQLVSFAVLARVFATAEGLLPGDPRLAKALRIFSLETGVLVGFGAMLLGAGLFVAAVAYWGRHGFGALPYQTSLRLIIPSTTLLALGVQIVFLSFFLSVLGIARK
ncbi:MAG: glycosyltransferase family 2 protein [Candidatus Sumerlaeota bacterium]|nr:glycosyltransferase family 2 protein [Candidatus Sumerlaeota bacterium]